MTRSSLTRAVIAALSLSLVACTPTPEKVCAHLKEISKDDKIQDAARCTTMMTAVQALLGKDKWKTASKCMMDAKDEATAKKCMKDAR